MKKLDFTISTLGKPATQSPISLSNQNDDYVANYVSDNERVLYDIESIPSADNPAAMLEKAGPRENIYFDPAKVSAAVVTCGGLCPGLNDVIRAIVMTLWYRYGIRKIRGIRFGYRGFLPEFNLPVVDLIPGSVDDIHRKGGTILGSSRGHGKRTAEIVDSIEQMNLNMLFVIGGDGTQKGALDISNELKKRNLKIAVVSIPKTIDNDISFVQRTFGFDTAVSKAVDAVASAHVEAHDAINGVGVVKVMGHDSGFIAAHTALAINDVNFVLIPEIPFELAGKNGLIVHLKKRLQDRNHAVILAAEGAGQGLIAASNATDASGNKKLSNIGLFLKQEITSRLNAEGMEINLKYIDPSYIIRSAPANANDSVYCARLGTNAVHAAMAGKTAMIVSLFNNRFVHVPIEMAVSKKKYINPDKALWRNVIGSTGQPALMKNP